MQIRLLMWSLRHRRWRHVLNAVIMAITVAVIVLFTSVVSKLTTFTKQSSRGRILVSPLMGRNELPMAFKPMFEQIDGALDVQCQKIINSKPKDVAYMISGEQPSGVEKNQDLLPVSKETFEAWKAAKPTGAILTETAARELNLTVGQEGELPTPKGPLRFKVVGLSSGGMMARRMAMHFDYLNEFMGNPGTCVYRVFADPAKINDVAAEMVERTKNSANPVQTIVDTDLAGTYVKDVAKIPTLLGFLGLFLALTTTLTLANSSAISIREQRTQIAALRVMGYLPRTVAGKMLSQSVFVGLVGGILGVIAVYVAVGSEGFSLTGSLGANILGNVKLGMPGVVAGLVASVLVPLIGALPATIATLRVPLVEALRDSA